MSEKTLGELAKWTFWDTKRATHVYADPDKREKDAWQAAADAIAAPLLARIAELEGELEEKETERREQCIHCIDEPEGAMAQVVAQYETLERENATLRSEVGRLGAQSVWAHERPCGYCGTPMYSSDPMQEGEVHGTCQAAYQRGVAEERERCAKVAEGLTRFLSCGGGNGHGIAESIRSASPAVDVTSDKGGEG